MISNKEYRSKLIEKYLNADTTVEEEIQLAEFFATGSYDADEEAVARLILACRPEAEVLSESGEAEFDAASQDRKDSISSRIIERFKRSRYFTITVLSCACAAVAIFFAIRANIQSSVPAFSPMEIAQNIEYLYEMKSEDIESIVAEPKGAKVFLTAKMKDGSSNTFIMTRNPEDGSTKILAQNNVKQ